MKKIKEIVIVFITFGIIVFLAKFCFNKFNYNNDILIETLLMSLGFVIGWFGYQFIREKLGKKGKC